jgi:hypothetical protein
MYQDIGENTLEQMASTVMATVPFVKVFRIVTLYF